MASPGITATGFNGGCESLNTGTPLPDAHACGDSTPTQCFGADHANPPIAPTDQVQLADSDHIESTSASVDHFWRWFARGYNVALMDDPFAGHSSTSHIASFLNTTDAMRYTLGDILSYANRMNLVNVVPWDNTTAGVGKSGTKYCLADEGTAYRMYFPAGSAAGAQSLTTTLSSGNCEWFDITNRSVSACTYQGTGAHGYTALGTGPYVLFVWSPG
jgi:hypothetical protein